MDTSVYLYFYDIYQQGSHTFLMPYSLYKTSWNALSSVALNKSSVLESFHALSEISPYISLLIAV